MKRLLAIAGRMRPSVIFGLLFATNGVVFGSAFGSWPWWAALSVGSVNLVLLVSLRLSMNDYFLAQFVGVDAIIRGRREPRILVVVPDLKGTDVVMTQDPSDGVVH